MLKKSQTTLGCNVLLKLNIGHFYVVVRFTNNIDKKQKEKGKKNTKLIREKKQVKQHWEVLCLLIIIIMIYITFFFDRFLLILLFFLLSFFLIGFF